MARSFRALLIGVIWAGTLDMEVAARLRYWRYLNHPYRQKYRKHREAEEADTRAAWEAANPDPRS